MNLEQMEEYIFKKGKFEDKKIIDIPLKQLDSYLGFLEKQKGEGVSFSREIREGYNIIKKYLNFPKIQEELERELES